MSETTTKKNQKKTRWIALERNRNCEHCVLCFAFVSCLLSPLDGSKGYMIRARKRRNKEIYDFKMFKSGLHFAVATPFSHKQLARE